MKWFGLVLLIAASAFAGATRSEAQAPPQIFDQNIGDINEFDLSPDGQRLVWLAERDNKKLVYIRDLFSDKVQVLPFVPRLTLPRWNGQNRYIYVLADQEGDENHHLLVYDANNPSAPPRDLTPYPGKKSILIDANNPDGSALVGINLTSPADFDVYRVSPALASPQLVLSHVPGQISWMSTMKGELFGRTVMTGDGKLRVETKLPGQKKWRGFTMAHDFIDLGDGIAANSDPLPDGTAWFVVRAGLDLATPQRLDLATGALVEAIPPDGADTNLVMFDKDMRPLLVQSVPGYPSLRVFDPALRNLLRTLPLPIHSFIKASSFNIAMTRLILLFSSDSGEENLVYVDRSQGVTQTLYRHSTSLLTNQLPRTTSVTIVARDNVTLHGYLTIPAGRSPENLPLVLNVHGGPWLRDIWGFDANTAILALQGYAVLRVNFRGSGGYGRSLEEAGIGEWGGKMQDDLTDAACWAISQGIADPRRMAIMGGSYGGYAAVRAMERTPGLFVAAIEEDGPVDLPAHLKDLQPYTKQFLPVFDAYIGKDPVVQWDRSPMAHIDRIEGPIMAFHGMNDPRVRVSQLKRFEEAMRAAGKDITTFYFEDEGHGVSSNKNMLPFFQNIKEFLGKNLEKPRDTDRSGNYCKKL